MNHQKAYETHAQSLYNASLRPLIPFISIFPFQVSHRGREHQPGHKRRETRFQTEKKVY